MKVLIIALLISVSFSFDTEKAIEYARTYCSTYNKYYKDYRSEGGGEDANFVSQCLIAGGLDLEGCGGRDEKGAIPSVTGLRNCLNLKGWKNTYGISKRFKAGYPFFDGYSHAMLITSINGRTITYCGHITDRCDRPMIPPGNYYYYYLP